MNTTDDSVEPKVAATGHDLRQERTLWRGIIILLIVASILLIGQSLYNLSNLERVEN